MEVGKLTVQHRTAFGKGPSRRIRQQGLVPGICYGFELEQPLPVVVSAKALKASLDPVRGRNTVIDLAVTSATGEERHVTTMLGEYQIDPIRRELTHVDFVAIDTEKKVEAEVPLELVGKAPGVVLGGTLHLVRRSLPVLVKPREIPIKFEIDVSKLEIGDSLHVFDLKLPEGVQVGVPDKLTLVTCSAPIVEEVAPVEVAASVGADPKKADATKKAEPAKPEAKK